MAKAPKKNKKDTFLELKDKLALQEKDDFIFPKSNIEFPVGEQFFHNGINLQKRTIIMDTETTGLDVGRDRIIEIAGEVVEWENGIPTIPSVLIKYEMSEIEDHNSDRYKELKNKLKEYEFHEYMSLPDGMKIPPESMRVHKITDEFLKEHGRDPIKVIEEFRSFCRDSIMVAHNASYDRDILENNCKRLNIDVFNNVIVDSLMMARQRFQGVGKYSLDYLSKLTGVSLHERESGHSADVDSRILAQLYRIMILGVGKKLDDFKINASNLDVKKVSDDNNVFSISLSKEEKKQHEEYLKKNNFPIF